MIMMMAVMVRLVGMKRVNGGVDARTIAMMMFSMMMVTTMVIVMVKVMVVINTLSHW